MSERVSRRSLSLREFATQALSDAEQRYAERGLEARVAWQREHDADDEPELDAELKHLAAIGVPERYLRLEVDEKLVAPELVKWALLWPETFGAGGGALVSGPPGTGKSVSAIWLLRRAYRRMPHLAIRRTRASDLYVAIFEKNARALEHARRADLLVIDDWGMQHESAWPEAEMDALVDRRWERCAVTVVTTNLRPAKAGARHPEETFEARYPRAWSRLLDSCGPGLVIIDRKDLRKRERKQ